jgi:hypothetical protein
MLQRRLFRKKILKPAKTVTNKITTFKLKKKYLKRRGRRFFKNNVSLKKINLKVSLKKIKKTTLKVKKSLKNNLKSKKILPS